MAIARAQRKHAAALDSGRLDDPPPAIKTSNYPPTDRQRRKLAALGYGGPSFPTRAAASQQIRILEREERDRRRPARGSAQQT